MTQETEEILNTSFTESRHWLLLQPMNGKKGSVNQYAANEHSADRDFEDPEEEVIRCIMDEIRFA